jgi:hypothetical protein
MQLHFALLLGLVGGAVWAFDCHTQVPEFPDFDIERVKNPTKQIRVEFPVHVVKTIEILGATLPT